MAKEKKLDANGYRKFGIMDKIAYAAGDFGCNMSFALKGTLGVFWMQFMKVDEITYGLLLLIVQIWDAVNDPLIGTMIDSDRRKYKLGKFRTYILIGSIGLIVAGAACFIPAPGAPKVAKYLLFIFGYILWDAFYTVANVPYGSMLNLITQDPGERAQLSSWRSIGSMVGNMAPMVLLPMLIYDASNNLVGEKVFFAALIMGIIGFVFFQIMIRNTVERVEINVTVKEDAPKFNFFKAFVNFIKNRPAMGATLAAVGTFVGMYGGQTASQVMFQAYFQNAQISGMIQLIGMLPMFLFIPFIKKIVSKFGKKEACVVGASVSLLGTILMVVLAPLGAGPAGLWAYVACQMVYGIGNGVLTCVSWSLMADAIDYNEWKFGNREEGTVYSLHSFFRKLAQGVGPTLGIFAATLLGYDGELGAAQPFEVATKMRYLTAGMYVFGAAVIFLSMTFVYNLDKKTLEVMTNELQEKRAANK